MKYREDAELCAFFDYVRLLENKDPRYKTIFHVANERRTSPQAGARLKKKGVRSGIPDVIVPIPSKSYHALFIEFKVKPNKLSDNQKHMCEALHAQGYCVRIAYSSTEAITILKDYLNEDPALS